MMGNQLVNISDRDNAILSVCNKIERMEGIFIGWYYAALMTGNRDAAATAFDMRREASTALSMFLDLMKKQPPSSDGAKGE